MAYGRRDGFSYADGVPLKLNEKLQLASQFVFPSFTVGAPDLLENEYDFSVEQRALRQYREHKHAKEVQEKAKTDKVAEEIEQFSKIPLDTGQQDTGQQLSNKTASVTMNNVTLPPKNATTDNRTARTATLPTWQSATLLNPQPLVKDPLIPANNVQPKQFNLADFESQSFSPFDTIELQTLNDLEELNTVFQGMAVTAEQKKTPSSETFPKVNAIPINGYQVLPDAKHYHRYSLREKPQNIYNGYGAYGNPMATGSALSSVSNAVFPRLKNSKSTPDIRDEIFQQTNWNRSQTPPPCTQPYVQVPVSQEHNLEPAAYQTPKRTVRSVSLSSRVEDTNIPSERSNRSPPVSQSEQPTFTECLPNPYHELEEKQQLFAATVAQMGFNLDRVARTVKHLGTDDKKVVDHLCHVQRLEESGYEGNDAETALHLYDYSFQEAKRFLDLLKQFQDLGFQKNAARKALIRHKNDRDRALDSLLLS